MTENKVEIREQLNDELHEAIKKVNNIIDRANAEDIDASIFGFGKLGARAVSFKNGSDLSQAFSLIVNSANTMTELDDFQELLRDTDFDDKLIQIIVEDGAYDENLSEEMTLHTTNTLKEMLSDYRKNPEEFVVELKVRNTIMGLFGE